MNQYAEEAKQRWGHTDAYKQSAERVAKMTKADMDLIGKKNDELMRKIAESMANGSKNAATQELIAEHYEGLRNFYEPNPAMYRGLAEMYVSDNRFTDYYEKYAIGLAQFMREAMICYADALEAKK